MENWRIIMTSYKTLEHLSNSEFRKRCKEVEEMYETNVNILREIESLLKKYKEQ